VIVCVLAAAMAGAIAMQQSNNIALRGTLTTAPQMLAAHLTKQGMDVVGVEASTADPGAINITIKSKSTTAKLVDGDALNRMLCARAVHELKANGHAIAGYSVIIQNQSGSVIDRNYSVIESAVAFQNRDDGRAIEAVEDELDKKISAGSLVREKQPLLLSDVSTRPIRIVNLDYKQLDASQAGSTRAIRSFLVETSTIKNSASIVRLIIRDFAGERIFEYISDIETGITVAWVNPASPDNAAMLQLIRNPITVPTNSRIVTPLVSPLPTRQSQ
jgi:hypothetical protein